MLFRSYRGPVLVAALAVGGLAVVAVRPFSSEVVGQPAKAAQPTRRHPQGRGRLRRRPDGRRPGRDHGVLGRRGRLHRRGRHRDPRQGRHHRPLQGHLPEAEGDEVRGKIDVAQVPPRRRSPCEDGTLTVTDPDGTTESSRYADRLDEDRRTSGCCRASATCRPTCDDVPSAAYPQLKASSGWSASGRTTGRRRTSR